jgi:DNA-binding transcriptional MerR regulator
VDEDGVDERDVRIDELARRAGVATTTVRLYQQRGLLPGPRLEGRTGYYGEHHLARLRLIARLQDEGFSLAGIGRLLRSWEDGRDLADLVGVEEQLGALLGRRPGVVLDPAELAARFPPGSLTPELLQRARTLGLVRPTDDGRFLVPDARFVETGAELARLGVPTDAILDQWEHLVAMTDEVAERFVGLFEEHLLPTDWQRLGPDELRGLTTTLARLQRLATQVLGAALDGSVARVGSRRLGRLLPGERPPEG